MFEHFLHIVLNFHGQFISGYAVRNLHGIHDRIRRKVVNNKMSVRSVHWRTCLRLGLEKRRLAGWMSWEGFPLGNTIESSFRGLLPSFSHSL